MVDLKTILHNCPPPLNEKINFYRSAGEGY